MKSTNTAFVVSTYRLTMEQLGQIVDHFVKHGANPFHGIAGYHDASEGFTQCWGHDACRLIGVAMIRNPNQSGRQAMIPVTMGSNRLSDFGVRVRCLSAQTLLKEIADEQSNQGDQDRRCGVA